MVVTTTKKCVCVCVWACFHVHVRVCTWACTHMCKCVWGLFTNSLFWQQCTQVCSQIPCFWQQWFFHLCSKTSVQKPHLIVYPGVRDANHDLVHAHEESLQYEETGRHHALMTQTSCFSKSQAVQSVHALFLNFASLSLSLSLSTSVFFFFFFPLSLSLYISHPISIKTNLKKERSPEVWLVAAVPNT